MWWIKKSVGGWDVGGRFLFWRNLGFLGGLFLDEVDGGSGGAGGYCGRGREEKRG